MPFRFKQTEPPCDLGFLSIVDGEALFSADHATTRDVKEATIRQLGWHRVVLPQDWFLSAQSLQTTAQVLSVMQCTIQYLKFCCKNEEKRHLRVKAELQHCEEERSAAFEELIELREVVALYKKQLREAGQKGNRNSCSRSLSAQECRDTLRRNTGNGLQCSLCENIYPSPHALESHFRKRHRRSAAYSSMATASAAVAQQQQQQVTQDVPYAPGSGAAVLPFFTAGDLNAPNLLITASASPSSPYPVSGSGVPAPVSGEERGLREEVEELRRTVAKLLEQQASFQKAMTLSALGVAPHSLPVPVPTSPTSTDPRRLVEIISGAQEGDVSGGSRASPAEEGALMRIQRELLHTSTELQRLRVAIEREEPRDPLHPMLYTTLPVPADGQPAIPADELQLRVPGAVAPAVPRRPTLDPQSFLKAPDESGARGASMDALIDRVPASPEAGGGETKASAGPLWRQSLADSFTIVSPISPSPPMATASRAPPDTPPQEVPGNLAMGPVKTAEMRKKKSAPAKAAAVAWAAFAKKVAGTGVAREGSTSAVPAKSSPTEVVEASTGSSPHALTAPSESASHTDSSTCSNGREERRVGTLTHTPALKAEVASAAPPPPPSLNSAAVASGKQLSAPEDTDSPMVRLPTTAEEHSHISLDRSDHHLANRYDTSQSGELTPTANTSAAPTVRIPLAVPPVPHVAVPPVPSLSMKAYGPVPSVPVLRDSATFDSPPPPRVVQTSSSMALRDTTGTALPSSAMAVLGPASSVTTNGVGEEESVLRNADTPMLESADLLSLDEEPRSPTRTPRLGSTPPTARVAQFPPGQQQQQSSGSPTTHPTMNAPIRSTSPHVSRSRHRSSADSTAAVVASPVLSVVLGVPGLPVGTPLAQTTTVPVNSTGKVVPVVHLVSPVVSPLEQPAEALGTAPAVPTDGTDGSNSYSGLVPLTSMHSARGPDAPVPAVLTNSVPSLGVILGGAPVVATIPSAAAVDSGSTYSVEAQAFVLSDDNFEGNRSPQLQSDDDDGGAAVLFSEASTNQLFGDVDVDILSADHLQDVVGEQVMEDVLTEDLEALVAQVRSEEEERINSPRQPSAFAAQAQALRHAANLASNEATEENAASDGTDEREEAPPPPPAPATADDDDVSDDYSYYSYSSSSDLEAESDERQETESDSSFASTGIESNEEAGQTRPAAAPVGHFVSSITPVRVATAGPPAASTTSRRRHHGTTSEASGAVRSESATTASSVHGGQNRPAAPAVGESRTPSTASRSHNASFNRLHGHKLPLSSGVTEKMKKASGVFKSIFGKKKK